VASVTGQSLDGVGVATMAHSLRVSEIWAIMRAELRAADCDPGMIDSLIPHLDP
jgi:hypothetical protein